MRRATGRHLLAWRVALLAAGSACAVACHHDPGDRVGVLRDALATDDPHLGDVVADLPPCAESADPLSVTRCLDDLATALGSKNGFALRAPNEATIAAAAVVLVRDAHGEWLVTSGAPGKPALGADVWLRAMARGKGPGTDALRLAVGKRLRETARDVGHAITTDDEQRALLRAVAASVPGACRTYAVLGAGTAAGSLPNEIAPEHAACVERDLTRPGGPGPSYGAGLGRASKGAELLWRETLDALRAGAAVMQGRERATIEADVRELDAPAHALHVDEPHVTEHDAGMAAPDGGFP